MDTRIDFFGPVELYVREEDGEWIAWADPFSELGTGATENEAIAAAQKSVEDYLALVAIELHRNASVRFLTPLTDEEKRGAALHRFNLCAVRIVVPELAPEVQPDARSEPPQPVAVRPLLDLLDVLPENPSVHATPVEAYAA